MLTFSRHRKHISHTSGETTTCKTSTGSHNKTNVFTRNSAAFGKTKQVKHLKRPWDSINKKP